MLKRSYCPSYHLRQPTYKDVTVCEEWKLFSVFRGWMEQQDWRGKALDKDLLGEGKKLYSPRTCCFIPQGLNNLLADGASIRGEFPRGVTYDKSRDKFMAKCSVDNRTKGLGRFDTAEDAEVAYLEFKAGLIEARAVEQSDERVKASLLAYASKLLRGVGHGK